MAQQFVDDTGGKVDSRQYNLAQLSCATEKRRRSKHVRALRRDHPGGRSQRPDLRRLSGARRLVDGGPRAAAGDGGAAVTEEIIRASAGVSYLMSLLHPDLDFDLSITASRCCPHGCSARFPGARHRLQRFGAKDAASFARFSRKDAEVYPVRSLFDGIGGDPAQVLLERRQIRRAGLEAFTDAVVSLEVPPGPRQVVPSHRPLHDERRRLPVRWFEHAREGGARLLPESERLSDRKPAPRTSRRTT